MKENLNSKLNPQSRIVSIDIFRGLTILIMLFVNDVAGLKGLPAWLEHADISLNKMTLVDVVFPAFLFIIGMAIPFSLEKRLSKAKTMLIVWKHILLRVLSLLIIGVFMVNTYTIDNTGILPAPIWILLMYVGVLAVWSIWPTNIIMKKWSPIIKGIGAGLLLVLAFLYKGNGIEGAIAMRFQWWGMIGLIGWAYLGACLFYIPFRKHPEALLGSAILLYFFYFANNSIGFIAIPLLDDLNITGELLGPHAAIILSGAYMGMKLRQDSKTRNDSKFIKWCASYGLFLLALGWLTHGMSDMNEVFIINKENSTPAWAMISSAFAVWGWALVYWLTDIKKWTKGIGFLKLAGANALFAYIIAPMLYATFELIALISHKADFYELLRNHLASGIISAILLTYLLIWLTGHIYKKGIWLKV